jgi:hypothetical protein
VHRCDWTATCPEMSRLACHGDEGAVSEITFEVGLPSFIRFLSIRNEHRLTSDQMPRRIFASCRAPGCSETGERLPDAVAAASLRAQERAAAKAPQLQSVIHVAGILPANFTIRYGDLL